VPASVRLSLCVLRVRVACTCADVDLRGCALVCPVLPLSAPTGFAPGMWWSCAALHLDVDTVRAMRGAVENEGVERRPGKRVRVRGSEREREIDGGPSCRRRVRSTGTCRRDGLQSEISGCSMCVRLVLTIAL
jgi:hypothetical protein